MTKMIIALLLALFLGLGEAGFAAAQSSPQALIESTA